MWYLIYPVIILILTHHTHTKTDEEWISTSKFNQLIEMNTNFNNITADVSNNFMELTEFSKPTKITKLKRFHAELELISSFPGNTIDYYLRNTIESQISQKNCDIITSNNDNTIEKKIVTYIQNFCEEDENFIIKSNEEINRSQTSTKCILRHKSGDEFTIVQNRKHTYNVSMENNNIIARLCENLSVHLGDEIQNWKISEGQMIFNSSNDSSLTNACCGNNIVCGKILDTDSMEMLPFLVIETCYSMSFVSLIIIFISAIVSKRYRREKGNQILVHFAFSIFAQILLFICSGLVKAAHFLCDFESLVYQYFALVETCWTAIVAYMQYKRYVTVLDTEPQHFIFRLLVLAYCFPIIPLAVRIFYIDQPHADIIMHLTISIPELIILITNTVIILLITKNIVCVRNEYIEHRKSLSMEVKLIFFLFMVLDFSWFSIIIFFLTSRQFFIYLFLFIVCSGLYAVFCFWHNE